MQYKQIGTILNTVFAEVIGDTAQVQEDLSNIVEVGETIFSGDTINLSDNNFDNYVRKLIDQVGKFIFRENELAQKHLPIYKDSWEFGSIAEKIRVEAPDTIKDASFDLQNYTGSDVFTPSLPKASAKFFNNSTTFSLKISIPKVQLKSAFRSAGEMSRFISLIENSISQKLDIDLLSLEYRTEANLIAEKFKAGNPHSVVNLLYEWLRDVPTARTIYSGYSHPADVLTDPTFLRFANMRINMYRDFIKKPSTLYGDSKFYNTTPEKQQTMLLLTDFERALDTWLYSMNRHNDFVKLDGYATVPYWLSGGNTDGYADRSTVNVVPASSGPDTRSDPSDPDPRFQVNVSDIIGVLHDERASAVMCEHRDTESINVPDARFVNYWYFCDANYVNDTDENAIVFYLSEYYPIGSFASEADFITATGSTNWATDGSKYAHITASGFTAFTGSETFDPDVKNVPLFANIANM